MSIGKPYPGGPFSGDHRGEALAETDVWPAFDEAAPDGPESALAARRAQYSLTAVIRTLYEHIPDSPPLPFATQDMIRGHRQTPFGSTLAPSSGPGWQEEWKCRIMTFHDICVPAASFRPTEGSGEIFSARLSGRSAPDERFLHCAGCRPLRSK